ncbi:MAG: GLPGLI family protein [Muribaculaceae bacterium]|nr:GLPGLI family protein [Muribaculaceae bacterium]
MKRLIASIIVCFVTVTMFSQAIADIEVSYTALSPNFKNGEVDVKNQYILLSNTKESKFFSPVTEYIDSLNSTPDGAAKLNEMMRAAVREGNFDDMPGKDGTYYIVKSSQPRTLTYYDSVGLDQYCYEETPEDWTWTITDSTKEILGYECFLATTDYHGRKWSAWFAPDIPVSNGPWKLDGLPGLILEASASDGEYRFVANGIQTSSKPIGIVYLADGYDKTDRKSFLKFKRAFIDNPIGSINVQMGGDISLSDVSNTSIFASSEVVDFIETDYH